MLATALTEDDGATRPTPWDLPASADESDCDLGCFTDHENPARERFYSRHLSASVPLCPAAAFGRSQSLERRRARSVDHERLRKMVTGRLCPCRSSEVRRGDALYFLGQCLPVTHASRNPAGGYGWPASRTPPPPARSSCLRTRWSGLSAGLITRASVSAVERTRVSETPKLLMPTAISRHGQ